MQRGQYVEMTLLEALQHSRRAILHDLLPVFSSEQGRPATPTQKQPLSEICTTTTAIGPHTFNTKLYASGAKRTKLSAGPATVGEGTAALTPAMIARLTTASAADPALATILRKVATGKASTKELAQLSKQVERLRKQDEADDNDAEPTPSTSTSWPTATTADDSKADPPLIVLEFDEVPGQLYRLPTHSTHTVLPSAKSAQAKVKAVITDGFEVLLSFFVFSDAIPVPVDLVVRNCTVEISAELLRCTRTGRVKDSKLEKWWKETIASVPPRSYIVDPPPPGASEADLVPNAPHAKRPAQDSGSATPMARRKSSHKHTQRGRSQSHSVTFDVSSTAVSPAPEVKPTPTRPTSSRTRAPSKRALAGMPAADHNEDDDAEPVVGR